VSEAIKSIFAEMKKKLEDHSDERKQVSNEKKVSEAKSNLDTDYLEKYAEFVLQHKNFVKWGPPTKARRGRRKK